MSFKIQSILDLIVKSLDRIIKIFDILLNALYRLLDYLIKTFEEVSKRILDLLTNLLRVIFYILPFILMTILGSKKGWNWMTITGWAVLVFVVVLFFRDFIAEIKGDSKPQSANLSTQSKKVFFVILMLNLFLSSYSIAYFFADISPEKYVLGLLVETPSNKRADLIRESEYLKILTSKTNLDLSTTLNAITHLGQLKSKSASPLLIARLNNFISKESTPDNVPEIYSIIEALEKIGGEEVCSSLVKFEVSCKDKELMLKSRKAANNVCAK